MVVRDDPPMKLIVGQEAKRVLLCTSTNQSTSTYNIPGVTWSWVVFSREWVMREWPLSIDLRIQSDPIPYFVAPVRSTSARTMSSCSSEATTSGTGAPVRHRYGTDAGTSTVVGAGWLRWSVCGGQQVWCHQVRSVVRVFAGLRPQRCFSYLFVHRGKYLSNRPCFFPPGIIGDCGNRRCGVDHSPRMMDLVRHILGRVNSEFWPPEGHLIRSDPVTPVETNGMSLPFFRVVPKTVELDGR